MAARWRRTPASSPCASLVLFPLFMVVSISLRPGNFATGDLIPKPISLEHWRLALGIPYVAPDGSVVPPPFPVLRWLWNSTKIAGHLGLPDGRLLDHRRLRLRPHEVPGQGGRS